jgi:hypothetical protein
MDLGGKKLVVKVDAKTKTVLDEYKGSHISTITAVSEQYTTHIQILNKVFGTEICGVFM